MTIVNGEQLLEFGELCEKKELSSIKKAVASFLSDTNCE